VKSPVVHEEVASEEPQPSKVDSSGVGRRPRCVSHTFHVVSPHLRYLSNSILISFEVFTFNIIVGPFQHPP